MLNVDTYRSGENIVGDRILRETNTSKDFENNNDLNLLTNKFHDSEGMIE